MRENTDSEDDSNKVNRRNVLRTLGAGGVATVAGIGQVSALSGEDDVLEKDMVKALLAELNDPEVSEVTIDGQDLTEEVSMERAEIETKFGTIVYAEIDEPDAGPEAYFEVDKLTGELEEEVPEKYRGLPGNTDLFLVYEDGDVVARRTATNPERKRIAEAVGFTDEEEEEMPIIYDAETGVFETGKLEENEEEDDETGKQYRIELEEAFEVNEHQETHKALREEKYTIEVLELEDESDDGGFSIMQSGWQGSDCWGLNFGAPCSQCVFGSGVCGGCAAVCGATGGLGCIPCIAGCAGTGGSCGCCLSCNSNTHNPVCY
ncbi:heterocycloanthracin/sonorensin family bacteriocin [Halopiger aswanensis]|uniref:Uncharacterized protein n=1 Tax=Halopiger aswanensis TaxID=148449 RepID=A0A419VXQ9_9EURY|nr:heterocycloanthracin/sonorensin family bacteriocin [Halopiger aswanensis]RKD88003.1 hypothetical protein ATJ93_4489 [Halopiger aswanensis]